ncbi:MULTISPECIES: RluA family pseudouridine synthase [unclassified Methylophaga]|uniref:RluA family pseudouridine synthase n=1 Tax=unclassified Methylophaga TaxID=2629249 RepID=UPI000C94610A|nr:MULTISPECIES: RluA family pseudouridine synthase [unclassified Methylophaga]MBN47491.1 RNA pseudouridine synthase [Methylophaga sp.]|tara:strand:+ start:38098 stop:38910 length:813 start_codon:yes stop_codon:yes gene_type:complete
MSDHHARFELKIPVEQGSANAVDLLAAHCELSRQQIKQAMSKGAVWLQKGKRTQRLRRATKKLNSGEILRLYYDKRLLDQIPEPPQLLHDFGVYSVWIKPAGMLAQGTEWGDHCSLLRVSELAFDKPRQSFLIQRLDREAYGLMIIAHQQKVAAQLSTLFQQRMIEKNYEIQVDGEVVWQQLTVNTPLDGKHAISHFENRAYDPLQNRTQLRVKIETGRMHQIRRHCASIGHPVSGDTRYGRKSRDGLQLKASRLEFDCPITHKKQIFSC